ncbi:MULTISPECIES: prepilin-type N-terminal cleavage/methylation domain-containing protein [unclassified Leptolyngbya]|uniref:prepilin-type N-terminal cleavage/methylation domain-containing protein n=1 Tax=unclassified Leptolyngbya TaxID=2650499 RepID=UPI001685F83C|nr:MULTISPECIES: prepilin-type N-terminal cleavage/methylation domain-containing protein [unclassified Leptolyngbya]MBD1911293.1 type II secretion system protein [Leptolyngbya sp. FACHB-8]MBD2156689.1 type II secretion system protein [Leptolyngbya sp. FACHB-16]
MKRFFQSGLRTLLKISRPSIRGFTLTELLIVAIVGSMIISGLLTLVVQLMTTDRQENVRLETNREMQMALDYMSNELKEAVYVYTGHCLMAQGNTSDTSLACTGTQAIGNPGGAIFPNTIASSTDVPVLVFWKQKPLPPEVRALCTGGTGTPPSIGGAPVPCSTASSYALVVYSLSTDNPNNTWRGGARIKRYELQEFSSATARTPGYIPPQGNDDSINFRDWPYATASARAGGVPAVLVDFVNGVPAANGVGGTCPGGYSMSPRPEALANAGNVNNNLRSFYACVSPAGAGRSQDVLIFLQGNIAGRMRGPSPRDGQLTTLQTRVATRGVLNGN